MTTPNTNDVLFGRGAAIMGHPGNRRLRSMVERERKAFVEAVKRKEKRKIATDIIQEIQNLQPSGRFLTEDPQGEAGRDNGKDVQVYVAPDCVHASVLNKAWACVEPDKALTKVMHRLREKGTGCGSGGGRLIEMQNQKRLVEQEKTVQHLPETKSVKAGFLTAQLPQPLIDKPTVTDANTTDSTTMPLEIFSKHYTQPPNQLNRTGFFDQIRPETHIHSGSEDSNNTVDLDGVLSLLNFAMQNQGAELKGNTDRMYAEVQHFGRP